MTNDITRRELIAAIHSLEAEHPDPSVEQYADAALAVIEEQQ